MKQLNKEYFDNLHMVLGFMADKDVNGILDLLPKKATFYFTQAQTSRSLPVEKLQQIAEGHGLKGNTYNNVMDALEAARHNAAPRDFIYIGGSMYVLAELLTAIGYDDKLDT
jgi:dihydrofolate synthase/folylpolyglutamate synthase